MKKTLSILALLLISLNAPANQFPPSDIDNQWGDFYIQTEKAWNYPQNSMFLYTAFISVAMLCKKDLEETYPYTPGDKVQVEDMATIVNELYHNRACPKQLRVKESE